MSSATNAVKLGSKTFNDKNVGRVKATVIGVEKDIGDPSQGESKAIANPWNSVALDDIIPPPFDLLKLSMQGEQNGQVAVCIEAMERNIVGYGWRLKRYPDVVPVEGDDSGYADAVAEEREKYDEFLSYADYDGHSFVDLRSRTRRDLEYTGNAYWEVIRDDAGDISAFNHIPAWMMRLRLKNRTPVVVTQNRPKGTGESRTVKPVRVRRQFRTFVQARMTAQVEEPSLVYFKEYGDPRPYHRGTGKLLTEENRITFGNQNGGRDFPESELANEVIHFKLYSSRSPYGLPRYIGVLLSVYGARAAEEINYTTFKNNNVPSMVLLISNGMLSGDSIDRITQFVETTIQGSDNRSKFLVLEAESFENDDGSDPGQVKIDIQPLTQVQHNDELFQKYQANNESRIRRAFRLPPILTGDSADYTHSTAETSRRLADEQVFDPERREDDHAINRVLRDMGIKYHQFHTNTPNVTNDKDLIEVLKGAEKSGGVTPRIARIVLEDVLGRDLGPLPEGLDPNVPFTLTVAEAVKNRGEAQAQVTSFKSEDGDDVSLADQIIRNAKDERSKGVVVNAGSQSLDLVDGGSDVFVHAVALGLNGRDFLIGDGFEIVGQVRFGKASKVSVEQAAKLADMSADDVRGMFPGLREVWVSPVSDRFKHATGTEYTQSSSSFFALAPDDATFTTRG